MSENAHNKWKNRLENWIYNTDTTQKTSIEGEKYIKFKLTLGGETMDDFYICLILN